MANLSTILSNSQVVHLRGYLSGLVLSTAGSSTTFSVAAGVAVDDVQKDFMNLAASISKTTSAWAVGSTNGGMDTGSVAASTWYHAYLIKRPDTAVVDVLFSLSASAPTMPTNYTLKRRIGSIKTNGSSQWVKFIQVNDLFTWDVPVADVSASALSTTSTLYPLSVPPGFNIEAIFHAFWQTGSSASFMTFQTPLITTQVANTPSGNISLYNTAIGSVTGMFTFPTDTSGQIRAVAGAVYTTPALYVVTLSWRDIRGKL